MCAHFNGFVFLFNINCKHIDKQSSLQLSHPQIILSIQKVFGMRIKLFSLEFIEIIEADQK